MSASSSCPAKNLPEAEMADWCRGHADECCRNHDSSKAIEVRVAEIISARSVEKFCFRYLEMLCDGDSSAFKAVQNVYHSLEVILECINQAHKRMVTALRKLAKEHKLVGVALGGSLKRSATELLWQCNPQQHRQHRPDEEGHLGLTLPLHVHRRQARSPPVPGRS